MTERHSVQLAEQLLVIAGMMMEDLTPAMVTGRRAASQLKYDAEQLLRTAADLASLAQCAQLLVNRAGQGSDPG